MSGWMGGWLGHQITVYNKTSAMAKEAKLRKSYTLLLRIII